MNETNLSENLSLITVHKNFIIHMFNCVMFFLFSLIHIELHALPAKLSLEFLI